LFACFALACGAADDDGTDLPDYLGPVPGGASTSAPPTGAQPGGPGASGPDAPAGSQGETPVTNGETPLTGGQNGNGSGAAPGQGTNPPGQNPPTGNTPPENPAVEPPPPDDGPPPANPPRGDRGTANLFVDLLGRTPGEVDTKVQTAVDRFFGIGGNDPATPSVNNGGARVFYVLPQDNSMGFIWAADSADIRSEGMSYGMFMAVQMNMQQQFDQLWRFARQFMQYPADSTVTAWRHYFRWTGTVNTSNANNWQVNYNAQEPPASDGEEYFATALYLADRRWGSAGEINYQQDADALSDALLNNTAANGRFPLIHTENDMVSFVPYGTSYEFSDPSYHLPAFYEIFAQDGPQRNAERWRRIAETSRAFLVTSAHPQTGLHPDYAEYDGSPSQGYEASNHDTFRFDAWRVPMNMAVDYSWSGQDARMRTQTDKYLAFFGSRLNGGNVSNSTFNLDGSGAAGGGASGLVGALGAAALASTSDQRMVVVNNLWNLAQPTGQFRYYQGSVYLLGLLATSGHFDYTFP
jgi:oligosaccharide reducing-end xylanase